MATTITGFTGIAFLGTAIPGGKLEVVAKVL